MEKTCKQFQTDITDYARGAFQYVKDYDALFNHLRTCEACRKKLFGLEELCYNLAAADGPSKEFQQKMAELKEKFRGGPPPLSEEQRANSQKPLARGIALFQQEKWLEARQQFDEAVNQLQRNERQISLSPPVCRSTGRPLEKGAGGILADAYYHRGLAAQKLNDPNSALKDFSRAIELDPDDADAAYHRGEIYSQLQQWTEAVRDFFRAIRLNPDYTEAYKERAWIYYNTKQLEKALADCERVLELEPANARAHDFRGSIYLVLEQPEKAILDFHKAIELDPALIEAYYHRGTTYLFRFNQPAQAIPDFSQVLAVTPQREGACFGRGTAYYLMNQWAKALPDLTRAIELNPANSLAYLYRGLVYGRLNQPDPAIKDFTRAIEFTPRDALVYHNRGVAYRILGEVTKAQSDFKKALSLNPKFEPSANELKALEAQVLYQEFEKRLNTKGSETDRIKELEAKIKILEEQVKSLTELVLQRPPSYIYPVMPGYMALTEERPGEIERTGQIGSA